MGRGGDGKGPSVMQMRLKGKQFAVVPPRQGQLDNVVLFKAYPRMFQGEKYEQKMPQGKVPAKGFLSTGLRGEALLVRRCEALKEMLEKDQRYARQARQKAHHLPPMGADVVPELPRAPKAKEPLYDLVFETTEEGPDFLREQLKLVADTKNPTRLRSGRQRDTGCYRTSMQAYGTNHYIGGKVNNVQASLQMIPKPNGFSVA